MTTATPMPASRRHIGGSILPSNDVFILQPLKGRHGTFEVRPLPEADTHGLFLDGRQLASHPNGYSCHGLAKRILGAWEGTSSVAHAMEQFDYILACGGEAIDRATVEQIAHGAPNA